jgi:beta-lactamase regulating signal transducer with metallopeptidase domain
MFVLRGIAVSFSVFAIVYCVLSLLVCVIWRRVRSWAQHHPVQRLADLLFALRMFPFAAAAATTAVFTVPSFLLLEPRDIDEPIGAILLVLGLLGAAICIIGFANALMTMRRALQTISSWTAKAQRIESCGQIPVLRIAHPIPPMTAVGIVRPKILLSTSAEFVLAANELQTALNHEIAHIHRHDNLRKLLLRFAPSLGMSELETAWLEATEMAADDAAVLNSSDALDLAAAIIKLSRLTPVEPSPDMTAALVHIPVSIMNSRVERLLAWTADRKVARRGFSLWYAVGSACVALITFILTYNELLARIHTATEWLVR